MVIPEVQSCSFSSVVPATWLFGYSRYSHQLPTRKATGSIGTNTFHTVSLLLFMVCLLFFGFPLQRTQMQNSFPKTDLPQDFTDATRAVLVNWLIQVHVSVTVDGVSSLSEYSFFKYFDHLVIGLPNQIISWLLMYIGIEYGCKDSGRLPIFYHMYQFHWYAIPVSIPFWV